MLTCIIVDDENRSIQTLETIITSFCNDKVTVVGTANNIDEAYPLIKKNNPNIVFLDIEMPHGSGFDLLEKFDSVNFEVIFTTGFDQYAVTAIKFSAIDYLLKPINITELQESIDRAIKRIENRTSQNNFKVLIDNLKTPKDKNNKIPLPVINGLEFVTIGSIVYCEADEDYTHVFLNDGTKMIVTKSIKDFEDHLGNYDFFRTHHSYLINKSYIKKYTKGEGGTILTELNTEIPVSRRRKTEFLDWINEI
jgi:two-component system, LytTR family, response regulator